MFIQYDRCHSFCEDKGQPWTHAHRNAQLNVANEFGIIVSICSRNEQIWTILYSSIVVPQSQNRNRIRLERAADTRRVEIDIERNSTVDKCMEIRQEPRQFITNISTFNLLQFKWNLVENDYYSFARSWITHWIRSHANTQLMLPSRK